MSIKITEKGLALLKEFEGCELKAYKCPAGVWTIGYGSVGDHVRPGLVITQEQAEKLLLLDLSRFEKGVSDLVKVPITSGQRDALISFSFNVGLTALESSTLLRLLNTGNHREAGAQFGRWNKAGGKALLGLTRRRDAEMRLYFSQPFIK